MLARPGRGSLLAWRLKAACRQRQSDHELTLDCDARSEGALTVDAGGVEDRILKAAEPFGLQGPADCTSADFTLGLAGSKPG